MLRLDTKAGTGAVRGAGPPHAEHAFLPRLGDARAWRLPKQLAHASAIAAAIAILAPTPSHALATLQPPAVVALDISQARVGANPLADLGLTFGGGIPEERDPITPFTLYGTSFKKYLIEQLQGEKIVSRKKGFTVNACVGAVEVTQESPQFQGLPTGDKALYAKDRVCRKAEGQDLKETCRSACEAACNETLDLYSQQVKDESGFALLTSDKARMGKSCSRNCQYECVKPGKAFDFVIPYRR